MGLVDPCVPMCDMWDEIEVEGMMTGEELPRLGQW